MKELLLLLSRYPYDVKDKPALERALRSVSDWKEAIELINAHAIIALSAYNIKESGLIDIVPAEAMTALNNGLNQTLVRNTWLTQRWKEVNTILTAAGIKHVLLKGMALEHTIYGGRGLRQMSDNDILVKPQDCQRAWNLLREHGFVSIIAKSGFHKELEKYFSLHLPALAKNNYMVELHYKLGIDQHEEIVNDAVDRALTIDINGTPAFILDEETHRTFLLEHLEKHKKLGDFELRQHADLENLYQGSAPDLSDDSIFDLTRRGQVSFKGLFSSVKETLPKKYWLKYFAGELIPSAEWMQNKYGCKGWKLVWYYPFRIFKILWR